MQLGMLMKDNTVSLFDTEVYDQIMRFITNRKRRSKNTAINYETDIRRFFKITRGKNIEHLNKEDLIHTMEEVEDYYSYLIDVQKVGFNTANRYLTSVKGCFEYLQKKGMVNDIDFLDIETVNDNVNHYGILTPDEIELALQLVLRQGKKETGLIKHLLIKFAADTSARLNECLNLKWSNFTLRETDVQINTIGKGNKEFKPKISKELYNEILKLKGISDSEFVFDIHRNTVQRMMNKLRKDMNIPKERNITFHSFKKFGVSHMYKTTRDLNQARKAANHSSTKTTELYIDTEEDYGVMGYFSSAYGVDENLYNKVDLKTLQTAISQLDKGQQMYINMKLDELANKKPLQN